MLPSYELLRQRLKANIANKYKQGYDTSSLGKELNGLPNDYEQLNDFAHKLNNLDYQEDWPYVEPDDLEDIFSQCDLPTPPVEDQWKNAIPEDINLRVKRGFIASLCGCILGKPIEVNPTLKTLKRVASSIGDWPIDNYISEKFLNTLELRHDSWQETTRENIQYVAPDDDINYTLLGMLILEKYGLKFTSNSVRQEWLTYLPVGMTFGPERTLLAKAAIESVNEGTPSQSQIDEWSSVWNPGDEYCGALIRMDAYGYACPGRPRLAVELAYKDAHFTHRKTGLYSSMFVAAAIALAPVENKAIDIFKSALKFVPKQSRFHKIVEDSILKVENAEDWQAGYEVIHGAYGQYCHCQIYQEIGTLINSLHFANNADEAICIQVSQGNDTDSFGATCGAIAGLFFNQKELGDKWTAPFNDRIYTTLAGFKEQSIAALAERISQLPNLTNDELAGKRTFTQPERTIVDYEKGI